MDFVEVVPIPNPTLEPPRCGVCEVCPIEPADRLLRASVAMNGGPGVWVCLHCFADILENVMKELVARKTRGESQS